MNYQVLRMRRFGVLALTGIAVLSGVAVLATSPAFAVAPTVGNFGAVGSPTVSAGQTLQPAGIFTFGIENNFVNGEAVTIQVTIPGSAANQVCTTAHDWIGFGSTPTVTVSTASTTTDGGATAGSSSDVAPTITPNVSTNSGEVVCGANGVSDLLTLTVGSTNAGTSTDWWAVTVRAINYNVGSATPAGQVPVALDGAGYNSTAGTTPVTVGDDSNAAVTAVTISANNPAVSIPASTIGSPSNIVISEVSSKALSGGNASDQICLTLSGGSWTTPATSTNNVTGSPSAASNGSTLTYNTGGGTATLVEDYAASGTPTATTFTINNANVTAPATHGRVTLNVGYDNTVADNCATAGDVHSIAKGITVYGVPPSSVRIFGEDQDGTAVANFEAAYPVAGGCTPNNDVVLATDANWPDALDANYLAGQLETGVLLTPTASLSSEAANAIALEGIKTVYIVGGPVAISSTVQQQLQSTTSTSCGGSASSGTLTVIRIYGQTADDTAANVALSGSAIGSPNLSKAYTAGAYDDTTGNQSTTAPAGSLKSAILVQDGTFQDAASASALAWNNSLPILLTPTDALGSQAASTITSLGIGQVIVVGGPLAVSDADVSSLEGLGVSVLRVAGQDYTDTSQELATLEMSTTADGGFGTVNAGPAFQSSNMAVARGDYYSDALTAGVVGANGGTVGGTPVAGPMAILLTSNPNVVGQYLAGFLNAQAAAANLLGNVLVIGGSLAIAPATVTTIVNDLALG